MVSQLASLKWREISQFPIGILFTCGGDHCSEGLFPLGRQGTDRTAAPWWLAVQLEASAGARVRTKRSAESDGEERRRKGSAHMKQGVGLCAPPPPVLLPSQVEGQPEEWILIELCTSLPEIKVELNAAGIFCFNIDLVLLSQVSHWLGEGH